ncbi:MAG: HDIG domain-containing protein [Ignavibacteriaceae bacterium]|nr:HDIG domain-containing protein [Ignavibacteriaceae bacterium]
MSDLDKLKSNDNLKLKILIGLVTVFFVVFMFPKGESIESEASIGSIWIHDDLIASFSFPVYKDAEVYKKELKDAAKSVFPIFTTENDIASKISDSMKSFNANLLILLDQFDSDNSGDNSAFLSRSSLEELKNLRDHAISGKQENLKQFFSDAQKILSNEYVGGTASIMSDNISFDSIAVRIGSIDKIETTKGFFSIEQLKNKIIGDIYSRDYSKPFGSALVEYTEHFVLPTLIYQPKLTNEEIQQAEENVSKYSGIVNENEKIIGKHDRVLKDSWLKIQSYKKAKGEKIGLGEYFLQSVGKFLHVTFLLTIFVIYLFLFRKKIFFDNKKILLIASNLIFLSFIAFITNLLILPVPVYFLIFIPAASMLMTIIFDSRIGFYTTIIFSLVIGALRGNDYSFTAMNVFAGALSVYTVRDIKNRSQIFRSFLFIFLGYAFSAFAFGLEQFASPETLLLEFAFAGSNALISPVLTYGLLIFFERIFNITTDLTLMELSNFDRPLLKELARKAPGSFNHSMTVGTLAETASESIGANPLLARVGAYYHDIGKIITPQNFVENQLDNHNLHENLTPEESVNLIKRHVNEGIELARENKIPEEIINFIPMHHGTTVISFFYDKAQKTYGEGNVNLLDYSYSGPKPNSKETAIVMLADSCESAVRSIDEPNPDIMENVIDNIIKVRIDSGQLDESPLTFSDIAKIKDAFISILIGQHHKRIKYPQQEEMEKGTSGNEYKK